MVNKLLNIIYEGIGNFIRDWQKSPYEWETEIDIQVEIASRLKLTLRNISKHTLTARYKDVKNKGFEYQQIYSRICCEPLTYYEWKSSRLPCYPDIVIYDDIKDWRRPPDATDKKINWPMLWVCEIKYENEFSGGSSSENKNWDNEKMEGLLSQKDGAKYACCIDFKRKRAESGNGIKTILKNNLTKYTVLLPSK